MMPLLIMMMHSIYSIKSDSLATSKLVCYHQGHSTYSLRNKQPERKAHTNLVILADLRHLLLKVSDLSHILSIGAFGELSELVVRSTVRNW